MILVHAPRVLSKNDEHYVNCGIQVRCANMEISYPFWGGKRPSYCGHPGYELKCNGDAPELTMMDVSYRVLDINTLSQNVTVARADYWNDYCPDKYVNTTLDAALFNYTSTFPNLTLYYDCPSGVRRYPNSFTCSDTNTNISVFYTATGSDTITVTCMDNVTVPIFQSAADDIENGLAGSINQAIAMSLLGEALAGGFGLELIAINNSLCEGCVGSGGQCGYNATSNEFACFCPDMPYPSTCPNNTNTGFTKSMYAKKGLITICVAVLILVFAMLGCLKIIKCPLACQTLVFWKKESEDDENVEAFIRNYGSLAPKRYNYSDVKKMTNSFTSKLAPDGRMVAVKLLSKSKGNGQDFINERSRRALIYEFMPHGSLDKFIYNRGSSNESLNLEWKTMYQIAVGIARGLEYLYRGCNTRILHFDIKPHNILLDQNFIPKISDFGLAKLCLKTESMVSMTHARGTTGYIAPEVFCRNFGGVSHKSDVYSYGMLVLEMVGGRKNIDVQVSHSSQIHFPTWIYKQLQPGKDLTVLRSITNEEEEETARKMVLVSLWCIQPNPSDRPSIDKVVEMLEGSSHLLEIPPNPFMFSTQNTPQSTVST
ncbi:hypothetical protein AAG906_013378 [Vitis piasezkii]